MNVLDSTLEPLAFSYLTFGFLTLFNNLWTWVAVVTAALSFWRIRSAGYPKPQLRLPSDDRNSIGPDTAPEALSHDDAVGEQEPLRPRSVVVGGAGGDADRVTKGKFTVYYEEDMDMDMYKQCGESVGGKLTVTETEEWEEREGRSEWWERLLRMRTGQNENGWYTWQDLSELNGNVVRLWDGGIDSTLTSTKKSWYSPSCIHVW